MALLGLGNAGPRLAQDGTAADATVAHRTGEPVGGLFTSEVFPLYTLGSREGVEIIINNNNKLPVI